MLPMRAPHQFERIYANILMLAFVCIYLCNTVNCLPPNESVAMGCVVAKTHAQDPPRPQFKYRFADRRRVFVCSPAKPPPHLPQILPASLHNRIELLMLLRSRLRRTVTAHRTVTPRPCRMTRRTTWPTVAFRMSHTRKSSSIGRWRRAIRTICR